MNNVKIDFDSHSYEKIVAMQPEEKLAIIKAALYSDDNLLRIVVKIMMIVDPESITAIMAWLREKFTSHQNFE